MLTKVPACPLIESAKPMDQECRHLRSDFEHLPCNKRNADGGMHTGDGDSYSGPLGGAPAAGCKPKLLSESKMKLIYIGDPMCSWCYGFGKELSALLERLPDLQLEIVVGGVRAGATGVLDEAGKRLSCSTGRVSRNKAGCRSTATPSSRSMGLSTIRNLPAERWLRRAGCSATRGCVPCSGRSRELFT